MSWWPRIATSAEPSTLQPDAGGARAVCEALRHRGLLAKETHETTIRIAPPLIIGEAEADWIADQFEAVL